MGARISTTLMKGVALVTASYLVYRCAALMSEVREEETKKSLEEEVERHAEILEVGDVVILEKSIMSHNKGSHEELCPGLEGKLLQIKEHGSAHVDFGSKGKHWVQRQDFVSFILKEGEDKDVDAVFAELNKVAKKAGAALPEVERTWHWVKNIRDDGKMGTTMSLEMVVRRELGKCSDVQVAMNQTICTIVRLMALKAKAAGKSGLAAKLEAFPNSDRPDNREIAFQAFAMRSGDWFLAISDLEKMFP